MAYVDPRYLEHQRKRFTRNNAHLYIRHDAWRFAPPGSPRYSGNDVVRYFEPESDNLGPAGERKDTAFPGESDWRDDPEVQRTVAEMKQDIRELLLLYKYSPDQPRVPAGNSDGGRWMSGEGDDVSIVAQAGRPNIDRQNNIGVIVRRWVSLRSTHPTNSVRATGIAKTFV
jgi:hypothetical protein